MLICTIIKPHAVTHAEEIVEMLRTSYVSILRTETVYFSEQLVHTLYDHMPLPVREEIARRLVGKLGLALLLQARSIDHLLEIVGTESDPSKCASGTIRERFGVHGAPMVVGSDPWWENAIHRPVDMREVTRDLWQVFGISRSKGTACYRMNDF
jgi:nucleoside diphosphate kinase